MPLHPASLRSPVQRRLRLRASCPGWMGPSGQHQHGAVVASAWLPTLRCRDVCSRRGLHEDIKRKNHYERLGVRLDATPAEIKKSFYSLSKTHHPDANRSDPNAAHAFSLFSESYTILTDASRRAAYDRDVLRLQHSHSHSHHQSVHSSSNPRASYSSTNPAGGRSPSGLSRRRGTFRGPPPSFYRSGAWGDQAEKRRRAHEESTGTGGGDNNSTTEQQQQQQHHRPWTDPSSSSSQHHQPPRHAGMGPGDDPFGHDHDVPHFDQRSHSRTHTREDQRRSTRARDRARRRAVGDDDVEFEPQASLAAHFFVVSGILMVSILAPLVYLQMMRLGRAKPRERT